MTAPDREALEALVVRVEALTGPCREVDAEIMAAFYSREERHIGTREGWDDEDYADCIPVKDAVWVDDKTDKWVSTHAKYFTASLDAAMTLVPEDAFWRLGHDGDGADPSEFKAQIIAPKLGGMDASGMAIASTPALALCAAALRAIATTSPGTESGRTPVAPDKERGR